jgi:hypothetical protein
VDSHVLASVHEPLSRVQPPATGRRLAGVRHALTWVETTVPAFGGVSGKGPRSDEMDLGVGVARHRRAVGATCRLSGALHADEQPLLLQPRFPS